MKNRIILMIITFVFFGAIIVIAQTQLSPTQIWNQVFDASNDEIKVQVASRGSEAARTIQYSQEQIMNEVYDASNTELKVSVQDLGDLELDAFSNVSTIPPLQNNDILHYKTASSQWVNLNSVNSTEGFLTYTAPQLTLYNTTEEDTAGGRESQLIFKGEQSGGEISTLAAIKASHRGSGDNEQGLVEILVNDGNDGNSPQPIVYLSYNNLSFYPLTDSLTAFQVYDSDFGTPVLNIDTTNERVGIGEAAPDVSLHINAGGGDQPLKIESTDANVDFLFVDNSNQGGFSGVSGELVLQRSGLYTGNGYVGINVTPNRKLEILDTAAPQLRLTHTDATYYADFQSESDGALTINAIADTVIKANTVEIFRVDDNQTLQHNDLVIWSTSETLADETSQTDLGAINASGWGFIVAGDNEEYAQFSFSADGGTITLIANSANVVTTDTDTKFCIIDSGGNGIYFKNRLGATKTIKVRVYY